MIRSYEDLEVYQRSKKLYERIVKVTRAFPHEGRNLADQIRRAANAIHANTAEGFGKSPAEFKRSLGISLGETNEVRSHLGDAKAAGYLSPEAERELAGEYTIIAKQLYRLRESWQAY